jgi:hypothetical protein
MQLVPLHRGGTLVDGGETMLSYATQFAQRLTSVNAFKKRWGW